MQLQINDPGIFIQLPWLHRVLDNEHSFLSVQLGGRNPAKQVHLNSDPEVTLQRPPELQGFEAQEFRTWLIDLSTTLSER